MNAARPPAVLLVDAEPASRAAAAQALAAGFEALTAGTAAEALRALKDDWVQVLIVAEDPPDASAVDLLIAARQRWPETVRVLLAAQPPASDMARAVNDAGVHQLLTRPCAAEQLRIAAAAGARLFALQREHERLTLEMKHLAAPADAQLAARRRALKRGFGFDRIVRAPDSPMEGVCRLAAQVASFDVPALILGETGVGKELLARAIHYGSLRADRPFHAVNCGAIPDDLLESELFGHRKGAFTGAHANRLGLLEQADGGTVFLDEIGDTSPAFQVKLLRFLQEGEIRPVGSNDVLGVDVRVVAASNRDLEVEAREGRFREDLYYRLAVCPVRVPPLRERPADIPLLAGRLLDAAMAAHGKRVAGIEREASALLAAYGWPGNVRELDNEITRLLMLCVGDRLRAADLSPRILRAAPCEAERDPLIEDALAAAGPLKDRVERLEARALREALVRHGWNKSRAADALGLSRVGLRAKLDRYGLAAPDDETPMAHAAE